MNPQTLPMPAMNYSASPSPQMVPMAYPPMLPLLDMTSITPPAADGQFCSYSRADDGLFHRPCGVKRE